MIDLSNNNGHVDFHKVRQQGHQRFVYLKRSEGATFTDGTFDKRYRDAVAAGLRVGAYHFARPSRHTPREEADHFLRLLPHLHVGRDLRPCLDLEDPDAPGSPSVGRWAEEWLHIVRKHIGWHPIIYGGAYYLAPCQFRKPPAWLWIAAYGRNDGVEHAYIIPRPWKQRQVVAHQFASTAHVPGCTGQVDLSHVLRPRLVQVRRVPWRR